MEAPKFTDFLVTSHLPDGRLNPEALDRTLNAIGAALIQDTTAGSATWIEEDGCYIMRVFGDPGFIKFACEHQGYCKIVGIRGETVVPEVSKVMDSVEYVYSKVADAFANHINAAFESEDALKTLFSKHLKTLPFDRTSHWSGVLFKELDEVWREHGPDKLAGVTSHDRFEILDLLSDYLDFNLYSQVALNLQNWTVVSYIGNADEELKKIQKKWEKYSVTPLSPGAKMVKNAFRQQDIDFNRDLSTVKSLKTISGIGPNISFRVTPKGGTPAFADSQNFSTIGVGGDEFVKAAAGHTVWYVCWNPGTTPAITEAQPNGSFTTKGIDYPFRSKSGGQILNEVLFSRGVAVAFWTGLGIGTLCLPRMNSVMVVTPQSDIAVKEVFDSLGYPGLQLARDKRIPTAVVNEGLPA